MDSQLLTPRNHTLLLVDHEGQMAFAVGSHPLELVLNATAGLAKAAALFAVPTVVTTVSERSFSGPLFPAIREALPDEQTRIERTTMNPGRTRNESLKLQRPDRGRRMRLRVQERTLEPWQQHCGCPSRQERGRLSSQPSAAAQ